MKIYDCFTYFNELDILALRLKELSATIERFCVVEGDLTFTGNPKPCYFNEFKIPDNLNGKFSRIKAHLPDGSSWDREIAQRNTISYFTDGLNADDIVIISDVDEIPNMDTVLQIDPSTLPVQLDVRQFFWNLHWEAPDHCNQGARPVVARAKDVWASTPQALRASGELPRVPNGGWHFSFFGGENYVANKIEAFAHTEYDSPEYKELTKIKFRIENGIDPFDRFPLKYSEVDQTYPVSLQSNC